MLGLGSAGLSDDADRAGRSHGYQVRLGKLPSLHLGKLKPPQLAICPRFLTPTRSDPSSGHLEYILQNLISQTVYVEFSFLQTHCISIFLQNFIKRSKSQLLERAK